MGIYIPNTFDVSGNAEVLGGGGGGSVPVPTGSTLNWDLQEFTTSGTWTKPAQAVYAEVVMTGAGGGGASGARQATGVVSRAGAGGGMPSVVWAVFTDVQLPSTVAVTIGAAGLGGAAVTADNTAGTSGGNGAGVSFGNLCSTTGSGGGNATFGGGSVSPVNTANLYGPRPISFVTTSSGTASSAAGGTPSNIGQSAYESYDRANSQAGGGVTNLNVAQNGGEGSRLRNSIYVLSTAAAGGLAPGGNGGNGNNNYQDLISVSPSMQASGNVGTLQSGTSGGGGAGSDVGVAGDAGAAGTYGVGGSGGGASRNGNNSGAGGAGSGGFIKVLTLYLT